MKRHRDIMFVDNPDDKPISIILTTLAAQYYNGEQRVEEALQNITALIVANSDMLFEKGYIPNPTLPSENFADKWKDKPERRDKFKEWCHSLNGISIGYAAAVSKKDEDAVNKLLAEHFCLNKSVADRGLRLAKALKAGAIGVGASGSISETVNAAGKSTKFYGSSN
jgi:hypothetical protein